jgi:hypothetical protein
MEIALGHGDFHSGLLVKIGQLDYAIFVIVQRLFIHLSRQIQFRQLSTMLSVITLLQPENRIRVILQLVVCPIPQVVGFTQRTAFLDIAEQEQTLLPSVGE